jgi:hypothetical protein
MLSPQDTRSELKLEGTKLYVPLEFYYQQTSPSSDGFPIFYRNGETYTTSEIWISHYPHLSGVDTGKAMVPYSFMMQLKQDQIEDDQCAIKSAQESIDDPQST